MNVFTLSIQTDNAAFDDDLRGEISRILIKLAEGLQDRTGPLKGLLKDINGNTVGKYKYERVYK